MKKTNLFKILTVALALFVASCGTDSTPAPQLCTVDYYSDTYDMFSATANFPGSHNGQTMRLKQADAIYSLINGGTNASTPELLQMFEVGDNFADPAIVSDPDPVTGAYTRLANKIGYGTRTYLSNSADADAAKADYVSWLTVYGDEVSPALAAGQASTAGVAGTLTTGTKSYTLDANGREIDQIFAKATIGALCYDNISNYYASDYINNLDNLEVRSDGSTKMEHYWDEAVGYIFGLTDPALFANASAWTDQDNDGVNDPVYDDEFLLKYLAKSSYPTQQVAVYDALIKGREAIKAPTCFVELTKQKAAIKAALTHVILDKAHYYIDWCVNNESPGTAGWHHYISEGYGFLYALQFTDLMSRAEVMTHLNTLDGVDANGNVIVGRENGFWSIDPANDLGPMAATLLSLKNQ